MSLCERNCQLIGYNYTTKKAICECKVKNSFTMFSNINFDPDKFLTKFTDIKTSTNLGTILCYKLLFSIEGLKSNIGSYIQLSVIFIHIISLFLFYIKGFEIIKKIMSRIISNTREKLKKKNIKKNGNTTNIKIKNNKNIKKTKLKNNKIIEKSKNKVKKENPNNPIKKIKSKKTRKNFSKINVLLTNDILTNNNSKTHKILKTSNKKLFYNNKQNISLLNKEQKNNNKNNKNTIFKLNDYEMNSLSYDKALKYDKRSYLQYYISLLKTKHLLIFTFCNKNDYNSIIIKICLLFFNFSLYFTVNCLFFNDTLMHKIYEDEGIFDFVYQIPQIFYSTAISAVINF